MSILKNKNCFISGATGGLGEEISKQLAKNGCNLVISSSNESKLNNLKKQLTDINGEISIDYYVCDFNNLNMVEEMAKNMSV